MIIQNNSPIKIAFVGLPGAGKTVMIATLLHRIERKQRNDPHLSLNPVGNRHQTLMYALQNWKTLENGNWPASTPAGDLVDMYWELNSQKTQGTINIIDCAGQDLRFLFSQDNLNPNTLNSDLRLIYNRLIDANILLVLINTKDLVQRDNSEEIADLDQMLYTLLYKKIIPRRITILLSQFDQYKPELEEKYNNNLDDFLYDYLPYFYNQYIHNDLINVIPVAAVADTRIVNENGNAKKYPAANFTSYNIDKVSNWIANSMDGIIKDIRIYKAFGLFRKIGKKIKSFFWDFITSFWKMFYTFYCLILFIVFWFSKNFSNFQSVTVFASLIGIWSLMLGYVTLSRMLNDYRDNSYDDSVTFKQGVIASIVSIGLFFLMTIILTIVLFWGRCVVFDKQFTLFPTEEVAQSKDNSYY